MSPGAWEPSAVPVWFDPLREPTWLVPAVKTDAPRILYCAERWGEGRVDGAGRDLRLGVQVVTPTRLDRESAELMRRIRDRSKPPAPRMAQFQQGLFSKLRDRFLRF